MTEGPRVFPQRPHTSDLRSGDRVLGQLTETAVDQPWIHCGFAPGPAWGEASWIFEGMRHELETDFPGENREAMTAYQALHLELHPVGDGEVIKPAILWIEGDTARYRY